MPQIRQKPRFFHRPEPDSGFDGHFPALRPSRARRRLRGGKNGRKMMAFYTKNRANCPENRPFQAKFGWQVGRKSPIARAA
jgi:hypothetical protein